MKFTITEVKTDSIKVEYEDKSWAIIPLESNLEKGAVLGRIQAWAPKGAFAKVSDVPYSVGETGDTVEPEQEERTYDYKEARQTNYPPIGHQLDALYWSRKGDDTQLTKMNGLIEAVKAKYPKNDTKYKAADL